MESVIKVRNPYTNEIIAEIPKPPFEHIQQSFEQAHNYWVKEFKHTPAYKRAEILYKVSDKIAERSEELALSIATEGGKPIKDALIEVQRARNTVKMSADYALNIHGNQIQMDKSPGTENHLAFTIKQPIGVVLAISAFNHPLNLICHQVATAIAAGNTVMLKPAEKTPLTARKIVDFFYESGLSPEALHYIPITGNETQEILGNPFIRYVSFIGNASIGWNIRKLVKPGVKVMLEHGGTAAAIINKDANLEIAIPSIVRGAYYHSGQVCVSTQLLYIHTEIYGKVLDLLLNSVAKLKTGNPIEKDTDCGPLITPAVVEKMKYIVQDATDLGSKILIGGKPLPNNCFEPTVLDNINTKMLMYREEVFGPLLGVKSFNDISEVLDELNQSNFAFQTAIYTNDINLALHYARYVEQKAVIINDSTAFRVDWMPFGGYKQSGFGTGGVQYAIEDMLETKLIVIRNLFNK